jgi:methyltransferase (TIGR00027 family)
MDTDKASRTALGVALHRAAHQLVDDAPLVFEDPLAVTILGVDGEQLVRRSLAQSRPERRLLRALMVARSRFVEDELRTRVERGVRQYVLLGAGLDTFAYRNPYASLGLRVFEVDHPATQAWKRQMLAAAGLTPSPALTFAPLDFEHDTVEAGLQRAGFRDAETALFAWMGVVPYLTLDAITATLRFIAGLAPATAVVFDYGEPPSAFSLVHRAMFEMAAQRVAALGEPWITFFEPAELERLLRGLRYSDVLDLDADAINCRYFDGRRDGLRVGPRVHLACATNAPRE